jgi:hypothetical protein
MARNKDRARQRSPHTGLRGDVHNMSGPEWHGRSVEHCITRRVKYVRARIVYRTRVDVVTDLTPKQTKKSVCARGRQRLSLCTPYRAGRPAGRDAYR